MLTGMDFCSRQDYEDFDLSNEIDELDKFLKLVPSTADVSRKSSMQSNSVQQNGNASSREVFHSLGNKDI